MIIDVWGIKTTRKKNEGRKQLYCYIVDNDYVFSNKLKGYKIRYTCDNKECKNPNKIHLTTSLTLLKNGWNGLESQMCRSCRSIKSEREVKGSIVPFDDIKKELILEGYKVLTTSKEYNSGFNQSQFPINVICKNGHNHYITRNNWLKGKRCRVCYEERKIRNAVKYKDGFCLYRYNVERLTNANYKKFRKHIDPKKLRSRDYHIDHKYSISQGFRDGVLPYVMVIPFNLEILSSGDNCSKNYRCSITKEELFNEYNRTTKFI